MRRIYLSATIIFATLISVMGIAYAYFSSTAVKMTGITLATATPVIQISSTNSSSAFGNSIEGNADTNLYPGRTGNPFSFYLRNISSGMVISQIIPYISTQGETVDDWEALKGIVEACFTDKSVSDSPVTTDCKTLADWEENLMVETPVDILVNEDGMIPNNAQEFTVEYRIPAESGGSEIQGKQITGMEWSFIGRTQ